MLLSIGCGYFGEAYVPSKLIVGTDAAATAANLISSTALFRIGFATYLIEAICDISLALVFYVLLKPVNKNIALLSAFFGLVSTTLYAVAELFLFGALVTLRNRNALAAFSPDQINTLALVFTKLFGNAGWLFLGFYGIATVLRGYLIYRSAYFPRVLGVLLIIGGAGFIAKNFTFVLVPAYASNALLLPMCIAGITVMLWFFIKGASVVGAEAMGVRDDA
jgi:hypothetical protein